MNETHVASQLSSSAGDWRKILAARQQAHVPGWLMPHVGKAAIVSAAAVLDPAIDSASLSATAVISTPTPDRSEDVVEPLGVRLENYTRNPVVFFDHGFSGLALPIAKSEDPEGALTVTVTSDGIEATSYFAQNMCESLQVFDLIEQKIIRSTSISMTPLVARVRTQGNSARPGLHIQEWDLLEWSWVGIPDNPEAVRKILDVGKLAGSPICDPIRKCLLPFAANSKLLGRGFSPQAPIDPKDAPMKKDARAQMEDDRRSATDDEASDERNAVDVSAPEAKMPAGVKTLSRVYGALTTVVGALDGDSEHLEHPAIAAYCKGLTENVRRALKHIQSRHETLYPGQQLGDRQFVDAEAIDRSTHESEDSDDAHTNRLRMYLSANPRASGQLLQLLQPLKSIGRAKNLSRDQRRLLDCVANRLEVIVEEAGRVSQEDAPLSESAWVWKFNDRLGLIEQKMTDAATKLLEAIPHRRP